MQIRHIFSLGKAQKCAAFTAVGLVGVGLTALLLNDHKSPSIAASHVSASAPVVATGKAAIGGSPVVGNAPLGHAVTASSEASVVASTTASSAQPTIVDDDLGGLALIDNSPVIMTSVSEPNAAGEFEVTKIVATDFKYPNIRIVEQRSTVSPSSSRLVGRSLMVADHVTVKLNDGVTLDDLIALTKDKGYSIRKAYNDARYALVSFPLEATDSLEKVQADLAQHRAEIAYAEIDYLRFPTAVTPNDTDFHRQGFLSFIRTEDTSIYSISDNIGAMQAWERRTDAIKDDGEFITIGIIDTGIAVKHEDLSNNIWHNPNEIEGNGIDDDNNGFVDDIYGWDFNTDSNAISSGGHATHVAGIVAAEGNNGFGVSGVAWHAKLVSADIFGSGITTGADAAEATRYLTALGVDIMNASYGASEYEQVECEAIQEAHEAGILFVTSAGNSLKNLDLEGNNQYPAECDVDNIIVVGGGQTRLHDLIDGQSNYGAEAVDIIAPIWAYSTYYWYEDESSYEFLEGTSMSSPMVAGSAALLMAEYPELSHLDIKTLLMDTATRTTPIAGTSQSGMLNLARAMNSNLATHPADIVTVSASADDGNVAENAVDGDSTTRWSALGYDQTITFELSDVGVLSGLDIQWLKGDQRAAKFSIYASADGVIWEEVFGGIYQGEVLEQSSGSDAGPEFYPVLNTEARYVRINGYGNTANDWNSIIETVIYVYDDNTEQPVVTLNAPESLTALEQNAAVILSWQDTSTGESDYQVRRREVGGSWSTVATLAANSENYTDSHATAGLSYEYRVRALDNATNGPLSNSATITLESDVSSGELTIVGVDASADDGNIADNTLDNSLDTRWSALGDGQWIDFSLADVKTLTRVNIAWYKGNQRSATFTLSVRTDGGDWIEIYSGNATGTTLDLEPIDIGPIDADTLRYTGYGNSANNWNSITEFEIEGY